MADWNKIAERVPDALIKTRPQGGQQIRYIEWHAVRDLLDERAPGWSVEIREIGLLAERIYVRLALTINGVTREQVGNEEEEQKGYGDPYSNAYAQAFKRAAAMFGIGSELYDKDYRPARSEQAPAKAATGRISPTEYWPVAKHKLGDMGAREHLQKHGGDFAKALEAL